MAPKRGSGAAAHAARHHGDKSRKKEKRDDRGVLTPAHLVIGGLAAGFAAAIFLFLSTDELNSTAAYDAWLSSLGVRRSKVEVSCNGTGAARSCRLRARRHISTGERVVQLPPEAVFDLPSILGEEGELVRALQLAGEEGEPTPLATVLQNTSWWPDFKTAHYHLPGIDREPEHQLGELWPAFIVAVKLWHERRLGPRSALHAWMQLLPQEAEITHVTFWEPAEAACLDPFAGHEAVLSAWAVDGLTRAVRAICSAGALSTCAEEDPARLRGEMRWAWATLRQRAWGELSRPLLLPLVDFALSHAPLCAPKADGGDGDLKCQHRDRHWGLQPTYNQEDRAIHLNTQISIEKGDFIYALPEVRSPWETVGRFGHVARVTSYLPDLAFQRDILELKDKYQINFATLPKDHLLKDCDKENLMHFALSGAPKKELRVCRAALLYCLEFPEVLGWEDADRLRYKRWRKSKVEVSKLGYLTWRGIEQSLRETLDLLARAPNPTSCDQSLPRGLLARQSAEASNAAMLKCLRTAERRRAEEFDKWAAADPAADEAIPLEGALRAVDATAERRDDVAAAEDDA